MKQKSKSFESSKFILQDQKSEHMGTELWENWNASQIGIWRKPFMPQSIQTLYLSMASTFYILYLLTNTSLYIITYYEFQYLIFNRFKTFWSGFLRCHFSICTFDGCQNLIFREFETFQSDFQMKRGNGGETGCKGIEVSWSRFIFYHQHNIYHHHNHSNILPYKSSPASQDTGCKCIEVSSRRLIIPLSFPGKYCVWYC